MMDIALGYYGMITVISNNIYNAHNHYINKKPDMLDSETHHHKNRKQIKTAIKQFTSSFTHTHTQKFSKIRQCIVLSTLTGFFFRKHFFSLFANVNHDQPYYY